MQDANIISKPTLQSSLSPQRGEGMRLRGGAAERLDNRLRVLALPRLPMDLPQKAGASSTHSKRCRAVSTLRRLAKRLECVRLAGAFGTWSRCAFDCWRWEPPIAALGKVTNRGAFSSVDKDSTSPWGEGRGEGERFTCIELLRFGRNSASVYHPNNPVTGSACTNSRGWLR